MEPCSLRYKLFLNICFHPQISSCPSSFSLPFIMCLGFGQLGFLKHLHHILNIIRLLLLVPRQPPSSSPVIKSSLSIIMKVQTNYLMSQSVKFLGDFFFQNLMMLYYWLLGSQHNQPKLMSPGNENEGIFSTHSSHPYHPLFTDFISIHFRTPPFRIMVV